VFLFQFIVCVYLIRNFKISDIIAILFCHGMFIAIIYLILSVSGQKKNKKQKERG